jgi:hypothetical protein
MGDVVADPVSVVFPDDVQLAVYSVMALPPLELGAVKLSCKMLDDWAATSLVGAPGVVAGVAVRTADALP